MSLDVLSRSAVVCTHNFHKVQELSQLLPEFQLQQLPDNLPIPPEIGSSFLDNARIKAHAGCAEFPDRWVIADDSGLVVDCLGGEPGVQSARYAGVNATDSKNVELLLRRLKSKKKLVQRKARFVCVLVVISPDGIETNATGTVEGTIAMQPTGTGGFGYDPVFIPDGYDTTFAELGLSVKSQLSHRARAAQNLQSQLLTLT